MAPPAADIDVQPTIPDVLPTKTFADHSSGSRLSGPLTYSGSLDSYEQFDVTAVIGRELPALQLTDILNDDTKVCDLAILGGFILYAPYFRTCLTYGSLSEGRRLLPQPGHWHR